MNKAKKAKFTVDTTAKTVTIREDGAELQYQYGKYPENIQEYLIGYGAGVKLQRSYAASRGAIKCLADKQAHMDDCHDNMLAGIWKAKREGGPDLGMRYKAMSELFDCSLEEAMATWSGMKDSARDEMVATTAYQAALATVKRKAAEEREAAKHAAVTDEDRNALRKKFFKKG